MGAMICSKCGNPQIFVFWKSGKDKTTALCEICYGDLSRDAKIINEEQLTERKEE